MIDILRNPEHRKVFCRCFNSVMDCRGAYGCDKERMGVACPLAIACKVTAHCDQHGHEYIGRAFKIAITDTLPEEKAKEILREAILGEKVAHPERSEKYYIEAIKEIK